MSLITFFYIILGAYCAHRFLKSYTYRIDSVEVIGALLIWVMWPGYAMFRCVARIYNGDWK